MNFASEYIKYLFNAKGRHGIHSPFVYDFVDKCLRIEPDQKFKSTINTLRKSLSSDKTTIQVRDEGAGSRKLGHVRSVQSIYKTASCKGVYAKLLFQVARFYKPQSVLELGTSLGVGTVHLAKGFEESRIISVDACQNTLNYAAKSLDLAGVKNVSLVCDTFENYLSESPEMSFDLVYIDGHHDGLALKKYMKQLDKYTHENTLFILDDIRWSEGMFEAWEELSASEAYHLSMDLFRMGILVKRPQQVKEHFIVKLKNVLSGF